jgi:hypothetical protein
MALWQCGLIGTECPAALALHRRKLSENGCHRFINAPKVVINVTMFIFSFSRIRKRFAYHCIKEKNLNKYTMRFSQAPKEVDLTQPKLDHPSKKTSGFDIT